MTDIDKTLMEQIFDKVDSENDYDFEPGILPSLVMAVYKDILHTDHLYTNIIDKFNNSINTDLEVRAGLIKELRPFNQQWVEAFYHMITIAQLIGIGYDDMWDYYDRLCKERNLQALIQQDVLHISLNYARHVNIWDDEARVSSYKAVNLISDDEVAMDFSKALLGRRISNDFYTLVVRADMMSILTSLNMALVTYEETLNKQKLKEDFMVSWLYFFKTLDLLKAEPYTLYTNIINLEL